MEKKLGQSYFINIVYQISISVYYLGYFLFSLLSLRLFSQDEKGEITKARLGRLLSKTERDNPHHPIWIHAVSGGEVKLAMRLIEEFFPAKTFTEKILVTYSSMSGRDMAKNLFQDTRIAHNYLPIDFSLITSFWCRKIKAKKFIIIEHDLWPNWLKAIKKNQGQRIIINYHLKPVDRERFSLFNSIFHFTHDVDVLLAQNNNEVEKVTTLLPRFKVVNAGNLKYGIKKETAQNWLAHQDKKRLLITLGSSHPGEEKIVLEALLDFLQGKKIALIIIPRHIDRSPSILKIIQKDYPKLSIEIISTDELSPKRKKNSSNIPILTNDVTIINAMGWSEKIYQSSDLVMIGDTFISSQGGHNFLEAVQYQKPTFYGEYMINYQDITSIFEENQGVERVKINDFKKTLDTYLSSSKKRNQLARNGFYLLKHIGYDKKIYSEYLQKF